MLFIRFLRGVAHKSAAAIFPALLLLNACQHQSGQEDIAPGASRLSSVDISVPTHLREITGPINIGMARNGWADFALRVNLDSADHSILRLPSFGHLTFTAYQLLPAAVDLDSAEYVRQTGNDGGQQQVPRVLLPLPMSNGIVDLSHLHTVDKLPVLIWIECYCPSGVGSGSYTGRCDLLVSEQGARTGSVPISLAIENVDLPTQPRLAIAAPLEWNDLAGLYPDTFEAITPRLLDRNNPQHAQILKLFGQLLALAHENDVSAYIPRLQPIVKWPPGQSPQVDWDRFDSITGQWLNGGSDFADHQPIAFWPIPEPDSLAGFDAGSRSQYWHQAVEHFTQRHWLQHSPIILDNDSSAVIPMAMTDAESMILSVEARQILSADSRARVLVPTRDDQTLLASAANPDLIPHAAANRLLTLSPGLIYPSPIRDWPSDAPHADHWINGDAQDEAGTAASLGTEQDLRRLGWLAFMRGASVVLCNHALPSAKSGSASVDKMTWFYPGQAYGIDHPLQTLQLKWLRKAQQDYEYLQLAAQHGDALTATRMCELITGTVKLLPGQSAEPALSAITGSADAVDIDNARRLLAARIGRPQNGTSSDEQISADPINLRTIRWLSQHQKPTLLPAGVRWMWSDEIDPGTAAEPGRWIDARVSVNIYNPADEMPNRNQLQWTSAAGGWEVHPQPIEVPSLPQFQLHRVVTRARFNLDKVDAESRQPLQLNFIDGFNGETTACKMVLPVAVSERRLRHLVIDGLLDDWDPADALQLDQPLIRMINRPTLQAQNLAFAGTRSSLYSGWTDDNFYLAFRLGGVTAADLRSVHNFVTYQSGRAWGEDLCELLIQPLYADNTVGPTLHIVCKPSGEWVERKCQPGSSDGDDWQPFDAAGVRYASGVDPQQQIWRGELAIPWQAIHGADRGRPGLLRFNFIQHQQATSQSSSWAGPIDQSRDSSISGLLLLREPEKNLAKQ